VRERMPACAAPAALLLVPEMPLLPSGKPDREALRAHAARASSGEYPAR
jgi:o-succinylbenzoate---CoA ligase